ncbi:hypothetical protein [Fulvivirga marina]|nr:hypothetical protein [Fulvivirga marina]
MLKKDFNYESHNYNYSHQKDYFYDPQGHDLKSIGLFVKAFNCS